MQQIIDIIKVQYPKIKKRIIHSSIFLLLLASLIGAAFVLVHIGERAQAASGDIIILWDGASLPPGWSCLSCASGQPFFNVFPRGSSTYGSASTSVNTNTHTASFATHTVASGTVVGNTAGTQIPAAVDTHGVVDINMTTNDHTPPYRNLKFISANTSTLPNGAIAMFEGTSSTLPANWSYYVATEGNYLRGENSSTTGGSAEHNHTLNATATAPTDTVNDQAGGSQVGTAEPLHTHNISGLTEPASNTPPFIDVVFAKLSTTSSIPNGLIAIFDATVPFGWVSVSEGGGDFNGNFIRGSDTYGASGGSSTHIHVTSTIVSDAPSNVADTRTDTISSASDIHTHDFSFNNFSQASTLPIYRDVIFARREVSTFTQAHFRWYQNADTSTPSIAIAAEDATATDVAQGEVIRLRINLTVATAEFETSTEGFDLEFSELGGFASCASVPGGNYVIVGGLASSTIWRGYNNTSTADGATLPSTLLASSTVAESYEEERPSALNPVAVPVGGIGEWDWVIQNNGALSEAFYCFRMVRDDGTELTAYNTYPIVQVVGPLTQIRYRWREDDGGE